MTQPERFARSWINILLLLLLISVAAGPVFADGDIPVPIGKILGDPEGYHLMGLTLRGTVSSLNALEPYYIPSGAVCYGAYTFQIEDDSGTLQMAIPGVCGARFYRPAPAADGDRVLLEANIQAPGRLGTFKGVDGELLPKTDPDTVHGIVSRITLEGE